MYAIISTGSKQFRVEPNDIIDVERLDKKEGHEVSLNQVLLVHDGKKIEVGQPKVKGASVVCEILEHTRGPKLIAFRFKRRKNVRRKKGHRQELTRLKVKEIKVS